MTDAESRLAQAIAKAEGYGIPDAIPTRAHNPGDLCLGDKFGLGVLGEGVTVCPTDQIGMLLLQKEVHLMLSGESHVYSPQLTLAQAGLKWSNGDPNWAKNVAEILGVSESVTLAQLSAV